ncbi:MAG: hypothetical protein M3134_10655 [Actinomycetota bacterium]|nr:hypothetical protein [Actinomycetota bacterium]
MSVSDVLDRSPDSVFPCDTSASVPLEDLLHLRDLLALRLDDGVHRRSISGSVIEDSSQTRTARE